MKIAIPVWGESQKIFENGGHAPYYGIYDVTGVGQDLQIQLLELRTNPKGDPDHHKKCHEDENDEEGCHGSDHHHEHSHHGFHEHHGKHHAVAGHGNHTHHGHHHGKGHHHGHHGDHGHSEEMNQKVMDTLKDCDHFLAEWACGRTQATIKKAGVNVKILKGHTTAEQIIRSFLEATPVA